MDGKLILILAVSVVTLANALVLALKMKADKKNNNPGNHGERIAQLETEVKNIKEDIKEIKDKLK